MNAATSADPLAVEPSALSAFQNGIVKALGNHANFETRGARFANGYPNCNESADFASKGGFLLESSEMTPIQSESRPLVATVGMLPVATNEPHH